MDLEWIRKGLERPGKSQRGLAQALGIDASQVSRLLKGERELKAREIEVVAAYLEAPPPPDLHPRGAGAGRFAYGSAEWPRNLPVYGVGAGSEDDSDVDFELNVGEAVDYLKRPPALANIRAAYAIYLIGESMMPWRRPGQPIIVNPVRPPRIGDRIVVQLKPKGAGEAIRGFVKELVKTTPHFLVLRQYNPAKDFQIERRRVLATHRVLELEDLLEF